MKINVVRSVLDASDAVAAENRRRLDQAGVLAVNILSAPGSGKTALLEAVIPVLAREGGVAVMVGDLQTTRDAERLSAVAAQVVQINTGQGCHLSPTEVAEGLNSLDLRGVEYLFIENVGNMVCPAAFDLGEHRRVVLLSLPEGDDKVAKYPVLFQGAHVILLTKVDLLGVLEFDFQRVSDDLSRVNTSAPVIRLSSRTGQGHDEFLAWLRGQRRKRNAALQS